MQRSAAARQRQRHQAGDARERCQPPLLRGADGPKSSISATPPSSTPSLSSAAIEAF